MDTPELKTPFMEAGEVVMAFNTAMDRQGWKAVVAGPRASPQVKFTPTSGMCDLYLHMNTSRLTFQFSKTACAWGDYMTALRRAVFVVLTSLKACGFQVDAPLSEDEGTLRIEYDQATRDSYVWVADLTDDWSTYEEKCFKALADVL